MMALIDEISKPKSAPPKRAMLVYRLADNALSAAEIKVRHYARTNHGRRRDDVNVAERLHFEFSLNSLEPISAGGDGNQERGRNVWRSYSRGQGQGDGDHRLRRSVYWAFHHLHIVGAWGPFNKQS